MKTLERKELKNLMGGLAAPAEGGTCGVVERSGTNRCQRTTGVSQSEAISLRNSLNQEINNGEVNIRNADSFSYCCDSCSSIPSCPGLY